jgi:hypothetical protein
MCQQLPPRYEVDLREVGQTRPRLAQVSFHKCSSVGYIVGYHKNTVCYRNAKFKFLRTIIRNRSFFFFSVGSKCESVTAGNQEWDGRGFIYDEHIITYL